MFGLDVDVSVAQPEVPPETLTHMPTTALVAQVTVPLEAYADVAANPPATARAEAATATPIARTRDLMDISTTLLN